MNYKNNNVKIKIRAVKSGEKSVHNQKSVASKPNDNVVLKLNKDVARFALYIDKPTLKEYVESLRLIVNNAEEYPNVFYNVEKSPSNIIYVNCSTKNQGSVREFLEQFGTVTEAEDERQILELLSRALNKYYCI